MEQKRPYEAMEDNHEEEDEEETSSYAGKGKRKKPRTNGFSSSMNSNPPRYDDLSINKVQALMEDMKKLDQNKATVAFQTLLKVIKNALEISEDPKYRTLKKQNKALRERLFCFKQVPALLELIGFHENRDQGTFVLPPQHSQANLISAHSTIETAMGNFTTITSTSHIPASIGSSSSSTVWTKEQRERQIANMKDPLSQIPQGATTVYCDSCNKARILTNLEQTDQDLSENSQWHCNMLPRLALSGCTAIDDEIVLIAGQGYGRVLSKLDIHTRADLAALDPLGVDAGASTEMLQEWILTAQNYELDDFMTAILAEAPSAIDQEQLINVGIRSPFDLFDHEPKVLSQIILDRLNLVVLDDSIKKWQAKAKLITSDGKTRWLEDWRYVVVATEHDNDDDGKLVNLATGDFDSDLSKAIQASLGEVSFNSQPIKIRSEAAPSSSSPSSSS